MSTTVYDNRVRDRRTWAWINKGEWFFRENPQQDAKLYRFLETRVSMFDPLKITHYLAVEAMSGDIVEFKYEDVRLEVLEVVTVSIHISDAQ